MSGATRHIAAFVCTRHEPPAEHACHLGRALIDTIGCALAATGSPLETIIRRWSERERSSGRSTVWTTGEQVSASQAAFLNGTAAHALDWDDVSPGSVMHPSTVLLPALLAAAEESTADGAALVAAHDVGAAVFRAVAQALPRAEHYGRGWHTTSTVGRLAAVAGLSSLHGLDVEAAQNALGLVASLSAGTLANFGTMTKPLHAGAGARDATVAVSLAADGFTANPRQLEADDGFFAVYGDRAAQTLDDLPDALEHWRVAWPEDWAVKLYPACYATHRAINAALDLRATLGDRLPERVEVVVEPGGLRPLRTSEPASPTEAKFSMAYVVSVALVHGDVRLDHFADGALDDEAVRWLMRRVHARESGVPPIGPSTYRDGYAVVRLDTGVERRTDDTPGSPSSRLSDSELDAKFSDCCRAGGLPSAAAGRLTAALRALPAAGGVSSLRDVLGIG
jgi:2-methylcitrate dehydratase PrpD